MQPLEIDSAVFCDGAHYTIISREDSSILTCPVTSGAGGYTLNRVEGRNIDREIGRLTGHAACIAVDVPTWCRIAGDPLDAVADALADLLDETPTRFELERLAAASPVLTANTPGIPVFPGGIAADRELLHARRVLPLRARARAVEPGAVPHRAHRRGGGDLGAGLPVREHAFTRRGRIPIIRAISAPPAPSARRTA